jgi:hypothetical protein
VICIDPCDSFSDVLFPGGSGTSSAGFPTIDGGRCATPIRLWPK